MSIYSSWCENSLSFRHTFQLSKGKIRFMQHYSSIIIAFSWKETYNVYSTLESKNFIKLFSLHDKDPRKQIFESHDTYGAISVNEKQREIMRSQNYNLVCTYNRLIIITFIGTKYHV